jgi:hypothetical protein
MIRFLNLVIASLLISLNTFAGVDSSGGGPSVVKFDAQGKVASAQLLDVFEAPLRYGLNIQNSTKSGDQIIQDAIAKMKNRHGFIGLELEQTIAKILKSTEFLPDGVVMAPGVDIADGVAALIPTGSQLLYVGFYQTNGKLLISKDIYAKLDETNRAALMLHEALYRMERFYHETHSSQNARWLTAILISDADESTISTELLSNISWVSTSTVKQPVLLKDDGSQFEIKVLGEMRSDVQLVCLATNSTRPKTHTTIKATPGKVHTEYASAVSQETNENCKGFRFYGPSDVDIEIRYGKTLVARIPARKDHFSLDFIQPFYWN